MKVVIDIPDEWKTRIEYNRRPNTIECGELVESIWKGKMLPKGKIMDINYDEVSLYCIQTADGENHYYDITELNEEMVSLYFWLRSRYGTLGPIETEFPIDEGNISAELLGAKYISKEQAMKECDKIILRLQNYVTNYRRKWKLAFGVHGKRDGYEALADEILKED